ncbi:MAG: nicotinate phosphoribosyltransferase [Erysipelothrix sp.]|nr:nicotinate phosphoribosyltransferase [Erysipelothrix sp.]
MTNASQVLVTDFYEFSMAYAYFKENKQDIIGYFDVFIRTIPDSGGYYVFNGLHKFIDFIQNFKFDEDQLEYLKNTGQYDDDFIDYLRNIDLKLSVYAVKEGTPVFANEPVVTIIGNLIEAQLIESFLLQSVNFSSLIATKASRMVQVDSSKSYLEFGTRRAHGADASIEGARAAYLAGFDATACTEAGIRYGVPVAGTMAHSYIQIYDDEYAAFMAFAKVHPEDCVFLVDTYDTLKSGVPNAIKVAQEYLIPKGYRLKGIRLDSGDLAYLSKQARIMLDKAGLTDTQIIASNSLDEFTITDLLLQGAPIDVFGIGERLITSRSHPVMGGVYKVVASMQDGVVVPTIKLSDTIEKITNPGFKRLYRFYDKDTDKAVADLIALHHETIDADEYEIFSPTEPWKRKILTNYYYKELQVPIFSNGKLVYKVPTLEEVKTYHQQQMQTLWPEVKRLNQAHLYFVDLSQELFDLKNKLIAEKRAMAKRL